MKYGADNRADEALGIVVRQALVARRDDDWDRHVQLLKRAEELGLLPVLARRRDLVERPADVDLQWLWLEDLIREHEERLALDSNKESDEIVEAVDEAAVASEDENPNDPG